MEEPRNGEQTGGGRLWVFGFGVALVVQAAALAVLLVSNYSLRSRLQVLEEKQQPGHLDAAADRVPRRGSDDLISVSSPSSMSFSIGGSLPEIPGEVLDKSRSTASTFGVTPWSKLPPEASRRSWRYIVIHHSATPSGSAEAFEAYHRSRGMNSGMAYHFVIANGTQGHDDGSVEIGARWLNQLPGGHCKQESINQQAIGICLVGDFTKSGPTRRQTETLASLVFDLQKQFDIPAENILGHGQVAGEFSECPGKQFPWQMFRDAVMKIADAEKATASRDAAFAQPQAPAPLKP